MVYSLFDYASFLKKILHYIFRKLTKELCDVVEHFSLVNFTTLDIQVR